MHRTVSHAAILVLVVGYAVLSSARPAAGVAEAGAPASRQSSSSAPAPSASSQVQETRAATPTPELERKFEALERQVNTLTNLVTIGGTVLAVFLALGAAGSIFSLWNFERRAREAHALAIRGEGASQQRASEVHQSFLEGSKTTLELVNATLTLAKEAGERAAHFLEEKAREALDALDSEAKGLLATAGGADDRALVADQRRRSSLMSVAQRLGGFEINRFILPRDIKLTPPCLFVRGMDHHLRQQFDDALSYWRQVALDENAEPSLRSLAWYWIGYEYNNLRQFSEAVSSFQQALNFSEGSRSYELQRIAIESRFFNKKEQRPEDLVAPLEMLLENIGRETQSEELEARRRKICGTLGNILHTIGENFRKGGSPDEAKRHYQRAAQFFSQASERDRWARFGLAEALYRGGEVEAARSLFEGSVLADAQTESINRMEPRTKVLARETELICYYRVPRLHERTAHMRSQVLESLGDVDTRLTVYSQLQRRNVSREEFMTDLDELERETTGG